MKKNNIKLFIDKYFKQMHAQEVQRRTVVQEKDRQLSPRSRESTPNKPYPTLPEGAGVPHVPFPATMATPQGLVYVPHPATTVPSSAGMGRSGDPSPRPRPDITPPRSTEPLASPGQRHWPHNQQRQPHNSQNKSPAPVSSLPTPPPRQGQVIQQRTGSGSITHGTVGKPTVIVDPMMSPRMSEAANKGKFIVTNLRHLSKC